MKSIFVFGSNLSGFHGGGSARAALEKYGAEWGNGDGLQGDSYAIPTKDNGIETMPLDKIRSYVEKFKRFATKHPEMRFQVVAIGCGLAGYKPSEIAPMFRGCPSNCDLPEVFEARKGRKGVHDET